MALINSPRIGQRRDVYVWHISLPEKMASQGSSSADGSAANAPTPSDVAAAEVVMRINMKLKLSIMSEVGPQQSEEEFTCSLHGEDAQEGDLYGIAGYWLKIANNFSTSFEVLKPFSTAHDDDNTGTHFLRVTGKVHGAEDGEPDRDIWGYAVKPMTTGLMSKKDATKLTMKIIASAGFNILDFDYYSKRAEATESDETNKKHYENLKEREETLKELEDNLNARDIKVMQQAQKAQEMNERLLNLQKDLDERDKVLKRREKQVAKKEKKLEIARKNLNAQVRSVQGSGSGSGESSGEYSGESEDSVFGSAESGVQIRAFSGPKSASNKKGAVKSPSPRKRQLQSSVSSPSKTKKAKHGNRTQLVALQKQYKEVYGHDPSPRMKNDMEWLRKRITEETKRLYNGTVVSS